MSEMTKTERDFEEQQEETQRMWEEVTGMQFLLSDDCDFLTEEQKNLIKPLSDYRGNDWRKVMHVARKLLRDSLTEWAEEVKDQFFHEKGRGLNQKVGFLGVRIRVNLWAITVVWFRFRKSGNKTFSETLKLNSNAKRLTEKQLGSWAKPNEIEAMIHAEEEFAKIRKCNEAVKSLGKRMEAIDSMFKARESRR